MKMSNGRILATLFLLTSGQLHGQNNVAVSPHWGGALYPSFIPEYRVGLHFIGFTQYGKERFKATRDDVAQAVGANTVLTEPYTFESYNDIDETLGFNVFAASETRLLRTTSFRSNLTFRSTVMFGAIDDRATRFIQNTVAHK